jgi:hypothetical protein
VILAHTEIAKARERQILGGLLVAAAYVARHPELAEHVDRALRPRFILES